MKTTFAGFVQDFKDRDVIFYQTRIEGKKFLGLPDSSIVRSAIVWESTGDHWFASCAGVPFQRFGSLEEADAWVRKTMIENGVLEVPGAEELK